MRYLLDTNTCIEYLNDPDSNVARRLRQERPGDVALCSVVRGELLYGAWHSDEPEENLKLLRGFFQGVTSLPFDDESAETYGHRRAALAARGTPIGPNDLLIASIALANDLTLVTHSSREFGRVDGLRMEDWQIGE